MAIHREGIRLDSTDHASRTWHKLILAIQMFAIVLTFAFVYCVCYAPLTVYHTSGR